MRILLIGANGQVGYCLHRSLVGLGEIIPTTRSGRLPGGAPCEVADLDRPETLATLVERVAPDLIVNAAAYTAVDKAESDRDAAFRANAESVGALAAACAARGARLVHYSTDYVFPGDAQRPWREEDPTGPLGVYGASKLAGEEAVRASGCRHMIFRTAWVYGPRGGNFLRTMLRVGAQRDELRVVADQVGSPTPAPWIAQATALCLAKTATDARSGTWNMVAGGEASWHGFAAAIFETAVEAGLLEAAPRVAPIVTADYPTPARRPAYSRLDTQRLHDDFGIRMPDWRLGLRQVIEDLLPP
ncbi:dTDP-4-dehydrorhamnose reductase [Coralloluteibacterium stylophorae]|uniref:dTDP-4-dehydrorhamnose reductase n=1 Tax=Coralloluteibacterium stylophorae TaxID=1776034 RepID=A0A8J7VTU8_9GAMM|nr:dTDP-4-dehydrorhamnose reductase [Coralloluteibacterium stylophorae]MBS7457821.1 dTDP-4-dehydrorhamnose reductase [Coralloluteibacterium stylophorae]